MAARRVVNLSAAQAHHPLAACSCSGLGLSRSALRTHEFAVRIAGPQPTVLPSPPLPPPLLAARGRWQGAREVSACAALLCSRQCGSHCPLLACRYELRSRSPTRSPTRFGTRHRPVGATADDGEALISVPNVRPAAAAAAIILGTCSCMYQLAAWGWTGLAGLLARSATRCVNPPRPNLPRLRPAPNRRGSR